MILYGADLKDISKIEKGLERDSLDLELKKLYKDKNPLINKVAFEAFLYAGRYIYDNIVNVDNVIVAPKENESELEPKSPLVYDEEYQKLLGIK